MCIIKVGLRRGPDDEIVVKNLKNFSKETYFELYNDTDQDIIDTHIYSVNDSDFNEVSRPNKNLKERKIPAHTNIRERVELTFIAANCSFKMRATFNDGTVDEFRVAQKDAIGNGNGFWTIKADHEVCGYRSQKNIFVVKIQNTAKQLSGEKNTEEKEKTHEAAVNVPDEGKEANSDIATRKKNDQAVVNLDSLKLEANNLFNFAKGLEREAFTLFKKDKEINDYSKAQKVKSMYKGVIAMYELAGQKFEEVAKTEKNFIDNVNLTKESIGNMKKLINEIENFHD